MSDLRQAAQAVLDWYDRKEIRSKHITMVNLRAALAEDGPETAWLLESGDKEPKYIGVIYGALWWTPDVNKALRLARRADGDALAESVEDAWAVREHVWPAAPPDKETR